MKKYIKVAHAGNAGDLIYSLSSLHQYCQDNDCKITFYIRIGVPSGFTDESHPVGAVMMNDAMYDFIEPLLKGQPYIHQVIKLNKGENMVVDFDLDLFRKDYVNLSAGNIQNWISNTYHEFRPNLSKQCLFIPENIGNNYIIVNRTTRYNNFFIDYTVLDKYENVYFVGTEKEFKRLSIHNDKITHLKVSNALEMAQYIAGCKLFIGGQSLAFSIAEQMKVKRILEQYIYAPNVIPQGGEWFTFHTDEQFKTILNKVL
jgi:hypothetical protein